MGPSAIWRVVLCAVVATGAGCAYEIAYNPAYVPGERPQYVADGKVLLVMPPEQQEFVYTSEPDSVTGDFTTLTVPMGAIVRDIAENVFASCFGHARLRLSLHESHRTGV